MKTRYYMRPNLPGFAFIAFHTYDGLFEPIEVTQRLNIDTVDVEILDQSIAIWRRWDEDGETTDMCPANDGHDYFLIYKGDDPTKPYTQMPDVIDILRIHRDQVMERYNETRKN